uniref:DNA-directed RNA polymerase n=1 Tax=viral metagenome TaxID=1070528 RepID=A0A6C0CHY7_9ZZZZ
MEPVSPPREKKHYLCGVFDTLTPDMELICDALIENKQISSDIIDDEILITSPAPQARLVLGFRKLLRLYADGLLPPDHPALALMKSICYVRILEFELDTSIEYRKAEDFFDVVTLGRKTWGLRAINDVQSAKENVVNSVRDVVDFFTLSRVREEYVNLVDSTWQQDKSLDWMTFRDDWNLIMVAAVRKYAYVKILNAALVTTKSKLTPIMKQLDELLHEIDFLFLSFDGLKRLILLLTEKLRKVLGESLGAKLVPAVSPARKPLGEDDMEKLLQTVKYTHVYHTIGDAAVRRIRSKLEKQLKGIQIEPVFIQQLETMLATKFKAAFVPVGYKVGMIAAQAVGENASQAGLRSFHHAGITGDTGFDRILHVTDMSNKNPFTIVALKDMKVSRVVATEEPKKEYVRVPATIQQANHYANMIESITLKDLCTFHIGKSGAHVAEPSSIFKGTPIFTREAGGWQDRYTSLLKALGVVGAELKSTSTKTKKAGLDAPDWFIRAECKRDIMFQRRISMEMIATAIEKKISDARVIISDILQGEIDIYVSTSSTNVPAEIYRFLRVKTVTLLKGIQVQGIDGFEKAIVEKYDIIKFITHAEQAGPNVYVHFSEQDVAYNGVTETQILSLLKLKSDGAEVGRHQNLPGRVFYVNQREKDTFMKRLRQQEAVRLKNAVVKPLEKQGNSLVVQLNRDLLRGEHGISRAVLSDFFHQQALKAKQFSSAQIVFDPNSFKVTISDNPDFNANTLKTEIDALKVEELATEILGDEVVISGLQTANITVLQNLIDSYQGTVKARVSTVSGKGKTFRLSLAPLPATEIWNQLEAIKDSCPEIFTEFVSSKQAIADRYRILTRGKDTIALSMLPFVNIYATIPSTPVEIFEHFDIEATRTYVANELVLNAGSKVGNRHLGLLADTLTYMGVPVKMRLSGKVATESGVLATAAFQEAFRILVDASASATADSLKSNMGQTLVGNFRLGLQGGKQVTTETKLDSAIDMLNEGKVSHNRPAKRKEVVKKRVQQKEQTVVDIDAIADLFRDTKQ